MSVSYFAEYSDGSRYQVVYDPKARKTFLRTTDGGFMDVPFFVSGGSFVGYNFEYVPSGLRPADVCVNIGKLRGHLSLLTPPQPTPATPIQAEPDKLHLLPREPGESRLGQLQRSVGQTELQARAERQASIRNQVIQADERDPRRVAEARTAAGEALHGRHRPKS